MPVIDDDKREEEFDLDERYERDRYHDSQISNIFNQIINPDSKIEDFIDECGRDRTQMAQDWTATRYMNGTIDVPTASGERRIIEVRPIETDEAPAAPAPAPVEAPVREQRLAQPDLVQDARVTSDLFRVKSTYEAPAPLEAPAPQFAAPQIEEEENEDLLPTMTTRQFGAGGDARGDAVRAADEDDDRLNIVTERQSYEATKREKTLVAVVLGVVVALVVLIIVNAAILMGMNRSAAAVETEYDEAVEALRITQAEYDDLMSGLDDIAEEFGMEFNLPE